MSKKKEPVKPEQKKPINPGVLQTLPMTEEHLDEPTPFDPKRDQVIAHTYKLMAGALRGLTDRLEKIEYEKTGLRSVWQKLWRTFIVTHHIPKERFKNDQTLQGSIYPKDGHTVGSYCKKFRWIHYVFKYKMFVPWLIICDKVLGRYVEDKIEDAWYNKNMIVWDKSWRNAQRILGKYYNPSFSNPRKGSYKSYNTIRKLWNTLVQNDTATKEFQNVFMHELTKNMNLAYKGHKEVYHVFYTGRTSYEPVYFTFAKAVMQNNTHPHSIMQQGQLDLKDRAKQVLADKPAKKGTTPYQLYKMCQNCKQLNHMDTQYCSKCGKMLLSMELKPKPDDNIGQGDKKEPKKNDKV